MFRVTVGIWKYFICMYSMPFYGYFKLVFIALCHVYIKVFLTKHQILVYCMYMVGYCSFQTVVYCNHV